MVENHLGDGMGKTKMKWIMAGALWSLGVAGSGTPVSAAAEPTAKNDTPVAVTAKTGETPQQVPPVPVPAQGNWEHSHEGPLGEAALLVEKQLRCNCGCMLDVHSCQYQMQCGTSPQWSQRIMRLLEEGQSEDAILAGFTADFGPNVLMTLPKEGFNWVGYLLPWIAILGGAAVVGVFLRRRVAPVESGHGTSSMSLEEWDRIQKELRLLEEEERTDDF